MKKLLVAGLLAAATFAAVRHGDHQAPADLVFDRIWINHMPRGERDPVQVFLAMDDISIGQFVTASRWAGNFEGFQYEAHDGELRVVFPQSGAKERMTVAAKTCDARGFDYCLTIAGSAHGAPRYYSRKDWVIERGADVDARVKAILAP